MGNVGDKGREGGERASTSDEQRVGVSQQLGVEGCAIQGGFIPDQVIHRPTSSNEMPTLCRPLLVFLVAVLVAGSVASSPDSSVQSGHRFLEDVTDDASTDDDANYAAYGGTIKYEKCFQDSSGNDVVFFMMCPAITGCVQRCNYGREYISDLSYFVKTFATAQLGADADDANEECEDGDCEEENNACEDGEDCEGDAEGFSLLSYTSCSAYGDDLYVGPYCKDYMIYLGLFTDNACTQLMDDDFYSDIYGDNLPYSESSGTSIVDSTCASCDGADVDQDQLDDTSTYSDLARCVAMFRSAEARDEEVDTGGAKRFHPHIDTGNLIAGLVLVGAILLGLAAYGLGYYLSNPGSKAALLKEKESSLLPKDETNEGSK